MKKSLGLKIEVEASPEPRREQEQDLKSNRSNPLVANTDLNVGDCCFQTAGSVHPQYLGKVIKTTHHDDKGTVEVEFLQEYIDPRKRNRVGKKIWVDEKKRGHKYSRPTETHQNRFARVGDVVVPTDRRKRPRPRLLGSPAFSPPGQLLNPTVLANRSPIDKNAFITRRKNITIPTKDAFHGTIKTMDTPATNKTNRHLLNTSKSAYKSKRRTPKRLSLSTRRHSKSHSIKTAWPTYASMHTSLPTIRV